MTDKEVVLAHLQDAFECLMNRPNPKGKRNKLERFEDSLHDRRRLLGRVLYCRQNGFTDEEIASVIGQDLLAACDTSDDEPR